MRVKPSKSLIALLAGVLMITLVGGLGLLSFQRKLLARSNQELADLNQEIATGDNIDQRLIQAEEALQRDQLALHNLEKALPNYAYVPTLLRQLEDLALVTKNQVNGVRPEPIPEDTSAALKRRKAPDPETDEEDEESDKPAKSPYNVLPITISMVGQYSTIQSFLDRLTRFPKVLAVQQLEVQPHRSGAKRGGRSDLLDVELKVHAYILDESSAQPAPAKAVSKSDAATQMVKGVN